MYGTKSAADSAPSGGVGVVRGGEGAEVTKLPARRHGNRRVYPAISIVACVSLFTYRRGVATGDSNSISG